MTQREEAQANKPPHWQEHQFENAYSNHATPCAANGVKLISDRQSGPIVGRDSSMLALLAYSVRRFHLATERKDAPLDPSPNR